MAKGYCFFIILKDNVNIHQYGIWLNAFFFYCGSLHIDCISYKNTYSDCMRFVYSSGVSSISLKI